MFSGSKERGKWYEGGEAEKKLLFLQKDYQVVQKNENRTFV